MFLIAVGGFLTDVDGRVYDALRVLLRDSEHFHGPLIMRPKAFYLVLVN